MEDQQTPAPEAGAVDVSDNEAGKASEGTENTQGQVETQADQKPEGEDGPSKSQLRSQRRKEAMDKLRAEKVDAEKRAREAEEKLAKSREQASPAPKEDDFETNEEYVAALAAHASQQSWDSRQQADLKAQQDAERERLKRIEGTRIEALKSSWLDQKKAAKERYTDFDQVVTNEVDISPVMAEMMATSEIGGDLAYHLGKNPSLATEISQMSPVDAAREMGRLEAKIEPPRARTVSNSPDPINPVRGGAGGMKDPDDMTMEEYIAARKAGQI